MAPKTAAELALAKKYELLRQKKVWHAFLPAHCHGMGMLTPDLAIADTTFECRQLPRLSSSRRTVVLRKHLQHMQARHQSLELAKQGLLCQPSRASTRPSPSTASRLQRSPASP